MVCNLARQVGHVTFRGVLTDRDKHSIGASGYRKWFWGPNSHNVTASRVLFIGVNRNTYMSERL